MGGVASGQRAESKASTRAAWIFTAAAVWLLQHDSASLPASRLLYKMAAAASPPPPPRSLPVTLPPSLSSAGWARHRGSALLMRDGARAGWGGKGKKIYPCVFFCCSPSLFHPLPLKRLQPSFQHTKKNPPTEPSNFHLSVNVSDEVRVRRLCNKRVGHSEAKLAGHAIAQHVVWVKLKQLEAES